MLVKMLTTQKGAEDGIIIKTYHEGREYDLRGGLGEIFVSAGWAAKVEPKQEPKTLVQVRQTEPASKTTVVRRSVR